MSTFGLRVTVREGTNSGPAITGAVVSGQVGSVLTDGAGSATIDTLYLTVEADGYVPYESQPYTRPSLQSPVTVALQKLPPPPPPLTLPELVVQGQFFQQADGTRWTAIGCSDFGLLARYQNEGADAIRPVLMQRMMAGFNLVRVWTAFDGIDGIGTFTTIDYSRIPAFVALCATYGLYIEFTAYTGWNDPAHWSNLVGAAYVSTPRPLLELVNELDQNTNEPDSQGRVFDVSDYEPAIAPLLTAHGSNGSEHQPVLPHWSYATMHFNGAFEWQRKTGHNSMEVWSGPTLGDENTRYPDMEISLSKAYDAAAGAALLCAGSTFHSVNGKASQLWSGLELAAAIQWAEGAKSVNLAYQDGAYRHATELEGPDDLRVYQRVLPDGSAETVHIGK